MICIRTEVQDFDNDREGGDSQKKIICLGFHLDTIYFKGWVLIRSPERIWELVKKHSG
jgi:hypothetical protein